MPCFLYVTQSSQEPATLAVPIFLIPLPELFVSFLPVHLNVTFLSISSPPIPSPSNLPQSVEYMTLSGIWAIPLYVFFGPLPPISSGNMFCQLSHFLLTHYVFCIPLSPIKPPLPSLSQSTLRVQHLPLCILSVFFRYCQELWSVKDFILLAS